MRNGLKPTLPRNKIRVFFKWAWKFRLGFLKIRCLFKDIKQAASNHAEIYQTHKRPSEK